MRTLSSLFDSTFFHMSVGFVGMLVGAFLVIGVAGSTAQKQMQTRSTDSVQAAGNALHLQK
jgi:hypothetical protein